MSSSLVSNTNQVHFASVLAMDNSEMVAMFEALVASGLNGFLGCMSDIFESTLIEFYHNASVQDDKVVSTVQGKLVEISEEIFARTLQLPMEGLIDINEVPKDLIFDAITEFSFTGEQLSTSCKKRELKIEYRLLSDIVAKSITVKAGSFDAVTHESFLLMTAIFGGVSVNWGRLLFKIFKDMVTPETRQARGYVVHICILLKNIPDLELGDSEEFTPLKILTVKTVGRYIAINDNIILDSVLPKFSAQISLVVDISSAPTDFVLSSPHQSSSSASSMHLTDDIPQGTTTAVASTPVDVQFSLPHVVSESFCDIRASMSRIIANQSKESRRLDDSHNEVLDKIKQLEKTILDAFYQQNQVSLGLIKGIRQDARNDTNVLSLGLKAVRTQTAILSTDQADARKEAKEQKAIIADMDERLATVRGELLDFHAQTPENYNNLSSQLGELVAYINRGNDKKGEESSSRRPQPLPDDQNRPSGGSSSRGDDIRGSSMKSGSSSSGAGGPYKKNAEWWLYGKNQF
ncbi:hypothetical protein F511_31534 [Dorcoceras hygrometricum]|uniref:Dystroglycan-like n=1 Tax=Dorcoceras hygrometricum TaxID=472368 RepID=A0A2Z7BA44_9LAMI|nr:hypothetical protein F511_31534 [Dorcoceras hygrometricum]